MYFNRNWSNNYDHHVGAPVCQREQSARACNAAHTFIRHFRHRHLAIAIPCARALPASRDFGPWLGCNPDYPSCITNFRYSLDAYLTTLVAMGQIRTDQSMGG
jgi:hypothetical protein